MIKGRIRSLAVSLLVTVTLVPEIGCTLAPEPDRAVVRLVSSSATAWTVEGIRTVAPAPTFNLSVEGTRTYFVGQGAVLAHNTSPCSRFDEMRNRLGIDADVAAGFRSHEITSALRLEGSGFTVVGQGTTRGADLLVRRPGRRAVEQASLKTLGLSSDLEAELESITKGMYKLAAVQDVGLIIFDLSAVSLENAGAIRGRIRQAAARHGISRGRVVEIVGPDVGAAE